jgi:hypothetical protein
MTEKEQDSTNVKIFADERRIMRLARGSGVEGVFDAGFRDAGFRDAGFRMLGLGMLGLGEEEGCAYILQVGAA